MNHLRTTAIERHGIVKHTAIFRELSTSALSLLLVPEQPASDEAHEDALNHYAEVSERFTRRAEEEFGEYEGYKIFSITATFMELIKNDVEDNIPVTTYLFVQTEPEGLDPTVWKRRDTYDAGVHTPHISRPTEADLTLLAKILNHLAIVDESLTATD